MYISLPLAPLALFLLLLFALPRALRLFVDARALGSRGSCGGRCWRRLLFAHVAGEVDRVSGEVVSR